MARRGRDNQSSLLVGVVLGEWEEGAEKISLPTLECLPARKSVPSCTRDVSGSVCVVALGLTQRQVISYGCHDGPTCAWKAPCSIKYRQARLARAVVLACCAAPAQHIHTYLPALAAIRVAADQQSHLDLQKGVSRVSVVTYHIGLCFDASPKRWLVGLLTYFTLSLMVRDVVRCQPLSTALSIK